MKFLFKQIDIAPLVFFRIIFGILAFADICGQWFYYHLYKKYFVADAFHFKYYWFDWVHPMPEPWMSLMFAGMLVAATLIVLGKWYRISALYYAITFTYVFLSEKALYLNHGYLFCQLCFFMALVPANRAFSLDVLKRPELRLKTTPYWTIFILQFLMGIVYFYGGIAKLNPDWLQAVPIQQWVGAKSNMPVLGWIWGQKWTAYFIAYGGVIFDLSITFFLIFKPTRKWAFLFVLFFHLTNTIIFKIGIFPWLSIAISALYFSPDFVRKSLDWLGNRLSIINRWREMWSQLIDRKTEGMTLAPFQYSAASKALITIVVILFGLFHLTYPFRHHLIKEDVAWTEEGHRFSWRMMLRSKRGKGKLLVERPNSDERHTVELKDYLNERQIRKLFGHPDMIIQFAHYIRDEYKAKGIDDVEIYAFISVSHNYRAYRKYIDSSVDLAKVKWDPFRHSPWIEKGFEY